MLLISGSASGAHCGPGGGRWVISADEGTGAEMAGGSPAPSVPAESAPRLQLPSVRLPRHSRGSPWRSAGSAPHGRAPPPTRTKPFALKDPAARSWFSRKKMTAETSVDAVGERRQLVARPSYGSQDRECRNLHVMSSDPPATITASFLCQRPGARRARRLGFPLQRVLSSLLHGDTGREGRGQRARRRTGGQARGWVMN